MVAPLPTHVPPAAVVPPPRRPYAAAFRALICAAVIVGVVIDLCLVSPGRLLSYFTVQSNILLGLACAFSAYRAWTARRPLPPWVTGGALLFICITGLVYHVVLAGDPAVEAPTGWSAAANILLHSVTPLAALADWLLLTPPGGLRPRHAGLWLLYPLAYFAFVLIRGALLTPGTVARYPYPFLDVDLHGYAGVLGNAVIYGLVFYALALVIVGLDRIRPYLHGSENRISSTATGPLK
ncbi:Pr6Pr family membrane protein [Streptomyces beijiangensis]|uniref:Pr6Pr family membrane protein n=1 Tax=Streptomyces beijiangensis TaxID=163361 RepID=A0A939JDF3_9ACTN|nr:Pr6Pr family membrane protein [Streptomyces beijiangensis]MBO0511966.1 Pr6Pr family membrane protein [Streptomyces beijiangensis]